ncbi:hypothetical protein BSK63_29965 [Paenibacillus odorifer]|nr:hypothetical protein BSK54_22535 [Paenibacillus odorifer]OME12682.1 hypothetical protein BSK57_29945 [Paenibacillus odorifer]OME24801.1 hypothetical protein BSK63_29965 [Paenibacillus odorifer]OME29842.1 hypothetical protein BSK46_28150 [Paenibacillus odorifer]
MILKKTYKAAITCTLLLNLALSSAAMAAPIDVDVSNLKEVQTSGPEKVWVGEWKGDDTIIVDTQGNVTTVGELKESSSFVPPADDNLINNELLAPELITPTFEPDSPQATLASAYGHAWPYTAENSYGINCYGYALRFPGAINPGDGDGVSNVRDPAYFTNVYYTAGLVVQDGNTNPLYFKPGWRILPGRTAAINSDEHRIALRVGWIDSNGNGKVDIPEDNVDYHFMLQNSSGLWSEKHGHQASQNTGISDPSNFVWSNGSLYGFYNSVTVYIAAKVF